MKRASKRTNQARLARWHSAFAAACLLLLGPRLAAPATGDDPAPDSLDLSVEAWSVWVGTPTVARLNTARAYPNAMPDVVGTSRPVPDEKSATRQFPLAPITVVQIFGKPANDVDIDLRVKKGTLLAHWPKGEDRSGRVQWYGSDLLEKAPSDLITGHLPANHWFEKLRDDPQALFLRNGNRVERFLAADFEVEASVPVRLRGGPDAYTLQNLTTRKLLDVAVVVPTEAGYRIAWIDELPAATAEAPGSKPAATNNAKPGGNSRDQADAVFQEAEDAAKNPDKEAKAADRPLPAEADPDIRARVDQILNRTVNVPGDRTPRRDLLDVVLNQARLRYELDDPTLAKADVKFQETARLQGGPVAARDALAEILGGIGLSYRITNEGSLFITTAARLAEEGARKGMVIEGPPVTLTLSQPLKANHPSYRELTRDSHARRLAAQGLGQASLDRLLDQYGKSFFEPTELVVLAHLSPDAVEESVSLDVFPTPRKRVHAAIVLCHGIDPRLQDQARELVAKLGDERPQAREEAEAHLFELGPSAVPALQDALHDPDIERVFRVERLLLRLNRPVP